MASQPPYDPNQVNPDYNAADEVDSPSRPWGKWEQSNGQKRHYSLEVIQHPIRARMCGFGDKDRRPLAPAAIAKMIVRNEQNDIVDVDDVEIDFFLVTCDLWSADGRTEVNLVRNPSSLAATRRRNRENPTGQSGSDEGEFAAASTSSRASVREEASQGRSGAAQSMSPPESTGSAAWTPGAYPQQQSWGGSTQPLPSINTIVPDANARTWPQGQQAGQYGYSDMYGNQQVTGGAQNWEEGDTQQMYGQQYAGQAPGVPQVMQVPSSSRSDKDHDTSKYTRTLVGPLTANAARLLDDKKQPGIFFTFQDLSVRTEGGSGHVGLSMTLIWVVTGTFRLRLRLMNVGAPPAPNRGATRVHEDVSPVLAQTRTDPFTVYSAKKFPGVPPMTALSLEFGKQGQKLPLVSNTPLVHGITAHRTGSQRNRPGSSGRPKARGGESEEEEGSGADSEAD